MRSQNQPKSKTDTACPFPRKIYIPEKRMERLCSEALVAERLMPSKPEPIRIERFIEKRFGIVIGYEKLGQRFGEGVMGACRFGRDGGVVEILVDQELGEDESTVGERRYRSTLAHEAGHGLFHGELFAEKFQADDEVAASGLEDTVCRQNVFTEGFACRGLGDPEKGSQKQWWEIQANMAMAALLLPRQLVDPFLRDLLKSPWTIFGRSYKPTLDDACRSVSEVFNVSLTMALYRIEKDFERLREQPELVL